MQKLTDSQLLDEIEALQPMVEACEQSPETRRILRELDLGRRNLVGDFIESTPEQVVERAMVLAGVAGCAEMANRLISIGDELEHRACRRGVKTEDVLRRLAKPTSDFWQLFHDLWHWSESELFDLLFPIACDCTVYPWPAYDLAAELLIYLDPRCPLTCKESLIQVSGAHLEASLRTLPFYLVTQFGKHVVLREAAELLNDSSLSEKARQNVSSVRYWSSHPASRLCVLPHSAVLGGSEAT